MASSIGIDFSLEAADILNHLPKYRERRENRLFREKALVFYSAPSLRIKGEEREREGETHALTGENRLSTVERAERGKIALFRRRGPVSR